MMVLMCWYSAVQAWRAIGSLWRNRWIARSLILCRQRFLWRWELFVAATCESLAISETVHRTATCPSRWLFSLMFYLCYVSLPGVIFSLFVITGEKNQ